MFKDLRTVLIFHEVDLYVVGEKFLGYISDDIGLADLAGTVDDHDLRIPAGQVLTDDGANFSFKHILNYLQCKYTLFHEKQSCFSRFSKKNMW